MEVVVFASRKGGSGKSTLAAHLAAHAHKPSRRCLLIDTDPQGSLALWHGLRVADGAADDLPLKSAHRNIADAVRETKREGFDWVFIDTAPNMSAGVTDAMRTATLVIVPCRPGVFDLDAVKETIAFAREARKPYAVVINAAPPKRQDVEAPAVTQARAALAALHVPVWGRPDHAAGEFLRGPGRRRGRQGIRFRLQRGGRNRAPVARRREIGEGDSRRPRKRHAPRGGMTPAQYCR